MSNSIMFPASKNFPLSKQQKSLCKSVYKRFMVNKEYFDHLKVVEKKFMAQGKNVPWVSDVMYETYTELNNLRLKLNLLRNGIF